MATTTKRAGAPKKMGENVVAFSYRTNAESWRIFTALATLKGETPTDVFRAYEKAYIEENGGLLRSAVEDLDKISSEDNDGYLPHIPNAETASAIREGRAGKGKRFNSVEALLADLRNDNDD